MMGTGRAIAFTFLWIAAPQTNRAQDAPAFRAGTHLVQINLVVRDRDGPVSNLTKEDFVLTDKGNPRQISVFSMTAPQASQPAPAALAEGTFSNRRYGASGQPASVTVVLLDRLNTLNSVGAELYESSPAWLEDHALGYAKQHLVKFVQQLDPKDRVAIYSLAQSLTVLSDFTVSVISCSAS